MIWGSYLLLIPLALIVFIIGIMSFFNKFGVDHFGFEFIENTRDREKGAEKETKKNKIFGMALMLFSILILLIPVIYK